MQDRKNESMGWFEFGVYWLITSSILFAGLAASIGLGTSGIESFTETMEARLFLMIKYAGVISLLLGWIGPVVVIKKEHKHSSS